VSKFAQDLAVQVRGSGSLANWTPAKRRDGRFVAFEDWCSTARWLSANDHGVAIKLIGKLHLSLARPGDRCLR
jgi:hypothetical protein